MSENLLINGDFEGLSRPGGWTRNTHTGQAYGEIFTPEGWIAWWNEGNYRRPEMKVIHKEPPFLDPLRIHSGEWALQAFTFYGRMDAGLYQAVKGLTPGREYELSAQAHAWSMTPGMKHAGDSHCSAGVGCRAVYILPGDVPPLNNEKENDAIGNFLFLVGVSFGEPNPNEGVTWCKGAHIYNAYHKVPPLRFIAPDNGRVVIYLRAISLWKFRNSDAHWDDVELVIVEEEEEEPPPPPEDRGQPRVQYARTYILLPPSAGAEWAQAVVRAIWDRSRWTFGGSADDSAVGNLDFRRVIAVNPQEWGDLAAFYEEHYPDIVYIPVEAVSPEALAEALEGLE